MNVISVYKAILAFGLVLAPLSASANASARAYLGDERVPGQVQPPYITGPSSALSQVGASTDAGYAYASANLNTGKLRVVGKSVYAPPYTTTADSSAVFTDSVTFIGGNGATAYLDYAFDGTLGVISDAIPKSAFAQMVAHVSTVATSYSAYQTLSAYSANCGSPVTNCVVGTSTARTGTLAFPIYANAPTGFSMSLNAGASIGNGYDFGNTAKFYLRLPSGVTYTSLSGSFLTAAAPITAVPEPETLGLLLAGLAAIALRVSSRDQSKPRAA